MKLKMRTKLAFALWTLFAISSSTYHSFLCLNTSGSTITLTDFRCLSDNNGTTTANSANYHVYYAPLTVNC